MSLSDAGGGELVGLVLPRAVLTGEVLRDRAGTLDQRMVGAQAREAQVAQARLARAEQLPLAAQLEVALRELEAVGRLDGRVEPRLRRVGQLRLRPRDQQAVGLLGAAADTPAQLVQ